VRAVITWVQLNDEYSADEVLASQCRSVDRREFRVQAGFTAVGADKACAASGEAGGADSATMAAVSQLEVVTVRLTSKPRGTESTLARAKRMLEGVLAEVAAGS
jgi:hypothetical protein